jgi:hypothetical protein
MGRNQKTGNQIYHSENAGTLDTKNKDELAQWKGNMPTKSNRGGLLMRDRWKQFR